MTRPINRANYGYAAVRLAALGYRRVLDDIDPRPLLRDGGSRRADDLRALGRACFAIARGRPIEAVARLETAVVSDETAGAAEVPRLRALAHVATGDYASAYAADRQELTCDYGEEGRQAVTELLRRGEAAGAFTAPVRLEFVA